jgi:tetratricopeptide (TPR) repeat protein
MRYAYIGIAFFLLLSLGGCGKSEKPDVENPPDVDSAELVEIEPERSTRTRLTALWRELREGEQKIFRRESFPAPGMVSGFRTGPLLFCRVREGDLSDYQVSSNRLETDFEVGTLVLYSENWKGSGTRGRYNLDICFLYVDIPTRTPVGRAHIEFLDIPSTYQLSEPQVNKLLSFPVLDLEGITQTWTDLMAGYLSGREGYGKKLSEKAGSADAVRDLEVALSRYRSLYGATDRVDFEFQGITGSSSLELSFLARLPQKSSGRTDPIEVSLSPDGLLLGVHKTWKLVEMKSYADVLLKGDSLIEETADDVWELAVGLRRREQEQTTFRLIQLLSANAFGEPSESLREKADRLLQKMGEDGSHRTKRRARYAYANGEYDEASRLVEIVLRSDPDNKVYHRLRLEILEAQEDSEALANLAKIYAGQPDNRDLLAQIRAWEKAQSKREERYRLTGSNTGLYQIPDKPIVVPKEAGFGYAFVKSESSELDRELIAEMQYTKNYPMFGALRLPRGFRFEVIKTVSHQIPDITYYNREFKTEMVYKKGLLLNFAYGKIYDRDNKFLHHGWLDLDEFSPGRFGFKKLDL